MDHWVTTVVVLMISLLSFLDLECNMTEISVCYLYCNRWFILLMCKLNIWNIKSKS